MTDKEMIAHCAECESRACAQRHDVASCTHCDEFACETLAACHQDVPDAAATLSRVRDTP